MFYAHMKFVMITGSAMPMPSFPAAAGAGAYRPPGANQAAGYQPYPPAYSGAGQPSQPSQIPATQPPYPGYPQGFAPYPQTTQTYPQQTGKTQRIHVRVCVHREPKKHSCSFLR